MPGQRMPSLRVPSVLLPIVSFVSFVSVVRTETLPSFTDVTAAAGIRFRHNNGAFGKKYLPETLGSGCAFLDVDNDGWQDILLVNSRSWPGHPGPPSYPA